MIKSISSVIIPPVFSNDSPSFCYSTGVLNFFGTPELFISSLPEFLSHELVNNYVDLFKFKVTPVNTLITIPGDRFPAYLIYVSKETLSDYV